MGEIVDAQIKHNPSRAGAGKDRTDWKRQHAVLMGQMEEVAGKDGFHFYYIEMLLPDVREFPDLPLAVRKRLAKRIANGGRSVVTVCVAKVKKPAVFVRGVSVCYPLDNPDKIKGRCFAMRRALRAINHRHDVPADFTYLGAKAFAAGGGHTREVKDLIQYVPSTRTTVGSWFLGQYRAKPTRREGKMFEARKKRA